MSAQLIKPILAFCLLYIVFSIYSNAQIVYTNLQPDVSLKCKSAGCSKTYSLDLNNDNTPDFNITTYLVCTSCGNSTSFGVSITPLNGNSVAILVNIFYGNSASALSAGYNINELLTWNSSAFPLRDYGYHCYFPGCGLYFTGNWYPASYDLYLGLKIISNNQTRYGWARLVVSVTDKSTSFKIKDYALENTPELSIIAGNTGTPSIAKPSNNNTDEDAAAELGKLKIAPNPISTFAIISFSLDQAEKVSLKIFDVTGRLVTTLTDASFEAGRHQVQWNATSVGAGIYFLQMETAGYLGNRKLIIVK